MPTPRPRLEVAVERELVSQVWASLTVNEVADLMLLARWGYWPDARSMRGLLRRGLVTADACLTHLGTLVCRHERKMRRRC